MGGKGGRRGGYRWWHTMGGGRRGIKERGREGMAVLAVMIY